MLAVAASKRLRSLPTTRQTRATSLPRISRVASANRVVITTSWMWKTW
jgi:hypothetical protein